MTDLRNYKDIIKTAVAEERQADENWNWSVKAINKSVVKIGWGYLDYLGEKECFTVKVDEENGTMVVGTIPDGTRRFLLVGPEYWNDVKTVEEGVELVIHLMAKTARNTY